MEKEEKYYRAYAEIDINAIRRNIEASKMSVPDNTGIIAVVKTDAYGHGAVAVSKAIYDLVEGYAVATVEEAVELRENGIDKHIIILGYVSPQEYDVIIEHDIIAAVHTKEQAEILSARAVELKKAAVCHIKVDTGMNRIGFNAKNEAAIKNTAYEIEEIVKLPMLHTEGIFMHFATSDEMDKTSANRQYDNFMMLISILSKQNIEFKYKHCSNSAAIIDMPQVTMDWVRQGITLYGLYPSDEVNKRRSMIFPALSLRSHVVHIKEINAGEGVSYGLTYVADKKTIIATVCIGYGDGYPRLLSNKADVLIHGKRAPIVGRICMDQLMVDITDIPEVKIEDVVTLVGKDGSECITVEELGELCGRFNYEFICDINKRVHRVYTGI